MYGRIMVHMDPAWGDQANRMVYVPEDDRTGADGPFLEQLWVKQTADAHYRVCCIPFRLYDIHLGDEIEVNPYGDGTFSPPRPVSRAGHATIRVWFGASAEARARAEVPAELVGLGCLLEWETNDFDLLAVSAPSAASTRAAAALLEHRQSLGHLVYETQHAPPAPEPKRPA